MPTWLSTPKKKRLWVQFRSGKFVPHCQQRQDQDGGRRRQTVELSECDCHAERGGHVDGCNCGDERGAGCASQRRQLAPGEENRCPKLNAICLVKCFFRCEKNSQMRNFFALKGAFCLQKKRPCRGAQCAKMIWRAAAVVRTVDH